MAKSNVSLRRELYAVALALVLVNGTSPANAASVVVNGSDVTTAITLGAAETLTFTTANAVTVANPAGAVVTLNGNNASVNTTNANATAITATGTVANPIISVAAGVTGASITNATGKTISNPGTNAAIAFGAGSTGTITNAGTISSTGTAIDNSANTGSGVAINLNTGSVVTGDVKLGGGTLTFGANSLTVTGDVLGGAGGTGSIIGNGGAGLTLANPDTITGNAGTAAKPLNSITVNDGKYLTINGSATANSLVAGSAAAGSAVLRVNGATVTGAINSSSATKNTFQAGGASANSTTTLNSAASNIGATASFASVIVTATDTLDASLFDNTISATNITIGSGATLKIGTGAITGNVRSISAGSKGTLEVAHSNTLATGSTIGGSQSLAGLIVDDGAAFDVATNNIATLAVDAVTLGSSTGTGAVLKLGTVAVSGTIDGKVDGAGALQLTGDYTLAAAIGATHSIGSVVVSDAKTLTTAANNISATTITLGSGAGGNATLSLGGGTLTGNIVGNSSGNGALVATVNSAVTGSVGGTKLASVTVNDGKSLAVSGSVAASTITVGSSTGGGATLTVGGSTIDGSIDSSNAGQNALVIDGATTLGAGGDIGAGKALASLTVNGGKSLDTSAYDNAIHAIDIGLGSGATLKLGSGTVSGAVNGSADGNGTLEFASSHSTWGAIGATHSLASVNVDSGATLTVAQAISATTTTIASSAAVSLGASTATITGNVVDNGSINLGTDVLTVASGSISGTGKVTLDFTGSAHGYIVNNGAGTDLSTVTIAPTWSSGSQVADGAVYLLVSQYGGVGVPTTIVSPAASGRNWTLSVASADTTDADGNTIHAGDLVMTASGSYVPLPYVVPDGTTDDHSVSNDPIVADSVTLGDAGAGNATLIVGTGTVTGPIDGDADGNGILKYAADNVVIDPIGATHPLALVQIYDGATLNAATNNQTIAATQVTLGNSGGGNARLILGTGSVNGKIDGDTDGAGILEIAGNNTLLAAVGSTHALASVVVDDGKVLDAATNNVAIAATQVTLGSGAAGTAKLKLGTGSVGGPIDGNSDGKGILEIAGNNTLLDAVGATHALASIVVDDGKVLDAATNSVSVAATAITLGSTGSSNGKLKIGTGAISGPINGVADGKGALEVADDNTLIDAIGSTHALASVEVDASKTLDAATNNTAIKATQVTLDSGSTLKLGTASVTGKIDGDAAGNGTLEIADNNTLAGGVGTSLALGGLQIGSGKTLTTGVNIVKANAINLLSGATLKVGTGAVTGAINGSADGNGTLEYASSNATTSAIGAGHSLASVQIDNGAVLSLGHNVAATATTVNAGGTISLASSATVTGNLANNGTLNLGTSVLTVASGALTGSGTIKLSLNSGTPHGYIVNNGAGADLHSMTIAPVWSGSPVPDAGATYLLVQNYSGTAPAVAAVAGANANWSAVVYSGATMTDADGLTIQAGDLVLEAVSRGASTLGGVAPQNTASFDALSTYTGSDPGVLALQAAAATLVSAQDVDKAGAQLRPDVNGVTEGAAFGNTDQFLGVVEGHNEEARTAASGMSGASAGSAYLANGLWGQVFGSHVDQGRIHSVDGYSGDSWGMAFGGDTELDASLRLGLAGGYARADISDAGARSGSSTTLDSYFASVYGTYTSRLGWYADSAVTYARHMYETSRLVTFILPNETAKGSFKADQLGGKLTAGYPLVFGAMTTTPVVSLDYNYLRQDGYTETGAPGANLIVDGQNTYSVRTGLGVNFAAILFDGEFRPSAHVAWYHEFNPNTMDMTSRYAAAGGQGFTTPGIKVGAETINVGAGIDLMDDDGITLSVKYDLDVRDGYVGNTGGLQFRVGF